MSTFFPENENQVCSEPRREIQQHTQTKTHEYLEKHTTHSSARTLLVGANSQHFAKRQSGLKQFAVSVRGERICKPEAAPLHRLHRLLHQVVGQSDSRVSDGTKPQEAVQHSVAPFHALNASRGDEGLVEEGSEMTADLRPI